MMTITIPVTKTEKIQFERRAKRLGFELIDFLRLAAEQFAPEKVETTLFSDEALASIKRSEQDLRRGRTRKIKSLADL